jgi:hypothetical protein
VPKNLLDLLLIEAQVGGRRGGAELASGPGVLVNATAS